MGGQAAAAVNHQDVNLGTGGKHGGEPPASATVEASGGFCLLHVVVGHQRPRGDGHHGFGNPQRGWKNLPTSPRLSWRVQLRAQEATIEPYHAISTSHLTPLMVAFWLQIRRPYTTGRPFDRPARGMVASTDEFRNAYGDRQRRGKDSEVVRLQSGE